MFRRHKRIAPAPVTVTRSWTYRYAGLEFTVSATTATDALDALRSQTSAHASREAHLIHVV